MLHIFRAAVTGTALTIVALALASCGAGAAPVNTDGGEGAPNEPKEPRNAAPTTATLTVSVDNLRNEQGLVLCTLFRRPAGFPSDSSAADEKARVTLPVEGQVQFTFADLEPGAWAVAVVHDENADGVLNRGLLGVPKEGYGVSNNPPKGFSAPSFEQARLELEPGNRNESVTVRYY